MFAPTWIIRLLASKSEENFKFAVDSQKQLTAAMLETKQTELGLLRDRIKELESQVKYERAKADSLYDRLLIRDAKVAPVQAVAQAQAHAEALDPRKKVTEELSRVFDQLASVGEADDDGPRAELHTFAGGGVVMDSGKQPGANVRS